MDEIEHHPRYKLFHNSKDNIDGMIDILKEAKESIDIEAFYFLPDAIGRQILDVLISKAIAGVQVRLLADSMGSFSLSQSLYVDAFRKAGAHIRFFNSFIPFSKTSKSLWYFRNHRRTIIIDKKELYVGSICVGEPTCDWIETGITVSHTQAVAQAQKAFIDTWHRSLHKTFKVGSSSKLSTDCFSYLTQSPMQGQRHIYNIFIDRIKNAKQSITLIAPYIVPDNKFLKALKRAKRRKIDIKIITSKETDSDLADLGRNTYILSMLTHGISIYFHPKMIHSKVAIFDNEVACISTMNLDNVSLRYNYECALYIDNKDCVNEILHAVNKDMIEGATKLHIHEWNKRSLWTQFLEILIWPVRKFL